MRTKLQLPNGVNLGLSKDVAYSLTFSIADIREPDKRDANYSKTISVPSSKEANKFFKSAFEIDGYDNYNANLKTECSIIIDGLEQIKGYLQLLSIEKIDKKYYYNVSIKGNVSNIFQSWGDQYLTDIDLSAYNHTYSKANIITSWGATVGDGYVYPLIDYGKTNGLTYDVENFYPAIYVKTYIDKFFELAGYTYNSDFFDSDFFKRLIIPYNNTTLGLTTSQITTRTISESLTVNRTYDPFTVNQTTIFGTRLIYNNEITDPSNAYSNITGEWVVPFTGVYKINASMQIKSSASGDTYFPYIARIVAGGAGSSGYNLLGGGATYSLTTSYQNVYVNTPDVLLIAGDRIVVIPMMQGTGGHTVTIQAGELQNIISYVFFYFVNFIYFGYYYLSDQ